MKPILYFFMFILLFIVSCSSTEQIKECDTSNFDIWLGCKVKKLPGGKMDVEVYCGGNPAFFEALLFGVDIIGQKMGYFSPIPPLSHEIH